MKKILIITITPGSAVDRLAEMVQKHNEHLAITIFPFHAKRYNEGDLKLCGQLMEKADLIDFEYWRGAEVLMREFPWLKDKKKILTHHNPYDLDKIDPKLFDAVVVDNKTQQENLPESILIPLAVDMDFFELNEDYNADGKVVGMVAFRIEGKKGIKEVAQACKELGYRFLLVGHVSRPDYMKELLEIGIDFREDVQDEELRLAYKEMTVLVCNSIDNFESGILPILEAMASGVPVLTRNVGHVPDIADGKNMVVRNGITEDIQDLKEELANLIDDKERRLIMREKGWQTVKEYNDYRRAKKFAGLYNNVMFPTQPLVSVVTATYNRKEQVLQIVGALEKQTYPNIELVVCDDNSDDGTEEVVKSAREKVGFPIKYLNTNRGSGYNLAMARNMGVIEADGRWIMILDSRLVPESTAVEFFVSNAIRIENERRNDKFWLFGNKGFEKTSFVENFSFIKRSALIKAGMFNERITRYGGMSQELRERFGSQGFQMIFCPEATAQESLRAQKMSSKRKDILAMKNLLWKIGFQKQI